MIDRKKMGWLLLAATLVRGGEDAHDKIFLDSEWYKTLKDLLKLCLEPMVEGHDVLCSDTRTHTRGIR